MTKSITISITNVNETPTVSQVTGAVAAYDFENGSGSAPSIVAGGPAISVGTAASYSTSAGRFDGSTGLLFTTAGSGTSGAATISSIPNVTSTSSLTVSGWIRFDAVDNWARFVDFGGGEANNNFVVGRSGMSNDLGFVVLNGSTVVGEIYTATNPLVNGTWVHVAASIHSDRTMQLYVNGTLAGQTTATSLPDFSAWNNNFVGRISFRWEHQISWGNG
jgi:hypothetical protein